MNLLSNKLSGAAIVFESAAFLAIKAAAVTFEQVYENPDDNELILNFARQQAAIGYLLSAAGALEDIFYS